VLQVKFILGMKLLRVEFYVFGREVVYYFAFLLCVLDDGLLRFLFHGSKDPVLLI
jgi:hypothetical protein